MEVLDQPSPGVLSVMKPGIIKKKKKCVTASVVSISKPPPPFHKRVLRPRYERGCLKRSQMQESDDLDHVFKAESVPEMHEKRKTVKKTRTRMFDTLPTCHSMMGDEGFRGQFCASPKGEDPKIVRNR